MAEVTPWLQLLLVSGILDIEVKQHVAANPVQVPICVILFPNSLEQMPQLSVNSQPPWLKSGADWHVSKHGLVCLDWNDRYLDHLKLLREHTEADLAEVAAQWIMRSAAYILHIHITCHAKGRTKWPKGADYWAHGDDAAPQYSLEKQALLRQLIPKR